MAGSRTPGVCEAWVANWSCVGNGLSVCAFAALEDLDIMAGGEDLAMFDEDEEFYAWAVDEMSDGVG